MSGVLLELLDCPRYLVSTDGQIFSHPDPEAIAKVIRFGGHRPTLLFNYHSVTTDRWDDPSLQRRYNYRTQYPEHASAGLRVEQL
jgi:hypothetical protein